MKSSPKKRPRVCRVLKLTTSLISGLLEAPAAQHSEDTQVVDNSSAKAPTRDMGCYDVSGAVSTCKPTTIQEIAVVVGYKGCMLELSTVYAIAVLAR